MGHGKYYYAKNVVLMQHIGYAVMLNVSEHGTVQHVKPNATAILNELILVSFDSDNNSVQVIHFKYFLSITGVCY